MAAQRGLRRCGAPWDGTARPDPMQPGYGAARRGQTGTRRGRPRGGAARPAQGRHGQAGERPDSDPAPPAHGRRGQTTVQHGWTDPAFLRFLSEEAGAILH